jgi:hypothetical protein
MCCQITPAIGIEPMKPMTTTRFGFIAAETSNAQHPTPNVQRPTFWIERSALSVER